MIFTRPTRRTKKAPFLGASWIATTLLDQVQGPSWRM